MRVGNINAVRVWGGGMYEVEEFYRLADENGVLIWHDLMFACSLYSAEEAFLESVRKEVEQNLYRARSHPSVLVWAGNNENEVGLMASWFYAGGYTMEQMKADYRRLYVEMLGKVVARLDPSREYLYSSPSNGIETVE